MVRRHSLIWLIAAVASLGCDRREAVRVAQASTVDSTAERKRLEAERAHQDSVVRSRPGYIVDSILPVEEEIRRFQATIANRPVALSSDATSRSDLVERFVRAIERNDTTGLAKLVVDRAEFGYLIYPSSPNAAPPYRQPPDLVWMTRAASTDKSMTRLLARFGGKRFGYAGYTCSDSVERQGANTLWSGCVVRLVKTTGDTSRLRMFGSIVEREHRYKFLSLTNGL